MIVPGTHLQLSHHIHVVSHACCAAQQQAHATSPCTLRALTCLIRCCCCCCHACLRRSMRQSTLVCVARCWPPALCCKPCLWRIQLRCANLLGWQACGEQAQDATYFCPPGVGTQACCLVCQQPVVGHICMCDVMPAFIWYQHSCQSITYVMCRTCSTPSCNICHTTHATIHNIVWAHVRKAVVGVVALGMERPRLPPGIICAQSPHLSIQLHGATLEKLHSSAHRILTPPRTPAVRRQFEPPTTPFAGRSILHYFGFLLLPHCRAALPRTIALLWTVATPRFHVRPCRFAAF